MNNVSSELLFFTIHIVFVEKNIPNYLYLWLLLKKVNNSSILIRNISKIHLLYIYIFFVLHYLYGFSWSIFLFSLLRTNDSTLSPNLKDGTLKDPSAIFKGKSSMLYFTLGVGIKYLSEAPEFTPLFNWVPRTYSLVFGALVVFKDIVCLNVLFLLGIASSVLLMITLTLW